LAKPSCFLPDWSETNIRTILARESSLTTFSGREGNTALRGTSPGENNMAAIVGLFDMQRQTMADPGAGMVLPELSSRV
jgi:hypothetical protein